MTPRDVHLVAPLLPRQDLSIMTYCGCHPGFISRSLLQRLCDRLPCLILHHSHGYRVGVAMVVHHGDEEEGEAMLVRLVGSVHADDGLAIELHDVPPVYRLVHK